jgi:Protein of unknown function (DUF4239)
MNYKAKFFLFISIFLALFFTLRFKAGAFYQLALNDIAGIPWLFSTIGLIFSILSGFLIQHLWDKWERIQKIVLEELHILEHILMFTSPSPSLQTQTKRIIHTYIQHTIDHEWRKEIHLLEANPPMLELKRLHDIFLSSDHTKDFSHNNGVFTKLINSLSYARQRRILLTTRRMPSIIRKAFVLSASLVIGLSLLVAIENILLDLIFTLAIGSLVFAIYLIIDDMDNILSPGEWHVSSKLYREFLNKIG